MRLSHTMVYTSINLIAGQRNGGVMSETMLQPGTEPRRPMVREDGLVWCSRCQEAKQPDQFHERRPGTYWAWCRTCRVQATKEYKQRKRRERIAAKEAAA